MTSKLFSCASLAVFSGACGGAAVPYDYLIEKSDPAAKANLPSDFVAISDTQYAEPFTDYDLNYLVGQRLVNLPPAVTTNFVTSFYRHAEAHFAVPLAMENVIEKESARSFGLFGGDLVEFNCKNEADSMFEMMEKEKKLPFIVTIGNHDALFHGSYDTDAIGEHGEGPWDRYSSGLWKYVCAPHGGPLTKSGFIRRLLQYYAVAWGFDFKKALGISGEYPLGIPLSGIVRGADGSKKTAGWELAFSLRFTRDDSPESHRQSYFFQRFTRLGATGAPDLTVTVLDATDYDARPALCDIRSEAVQIGMAGAISGDQIAFLESLPKVSGPALVLSHNLPFQNVFDVASKKNVDPCETTFGVECLGTRLYQVLGDAPTFVYGHVHRPFEPEVVKKPNDDQYAVNLIRLPSLIDDKQYAVFEKGAFAGREVAVPGSPLDSRKPFTPPVTDTCQQRFLEYVEVKRNIACFAQHGAACPDLQQTLDGAKDDSAEFCADPAAWLAARQPEHDAVGADCDEWPRDRARCALRKLVSVAANQVQDADLPELGYALLAAVKTKR